MLFDPSSRSNGVLLRCSLGGGEDYFSHKSGKYVDLHDNNATVFTANGSYSATLFANKYTPRHTHALVMHAY